MAKSKPVAEKKKAPQPIKRKVVAAKAPAPAKKPSGPTAAQQIAAIDEQIAALEAKKATFKEQAIQELKARILEANKVVRELENKLGENVGARKARRERRPSITDEALIPQVHAAMSKFGGEGLNAKQLAERLNQDALRVRKFISSNPKLLKRHGKGPRTKFFLP